MKTIIPFIVLVITFSKGYSQREDFWEILNIPEGGCGTSMAVNAQGDLFLENANGLFKSDDDGETWIYLGFDGIPIAPIDCDDQGNVILGNYAYNVPYSIHKSIDNGQTWYGIWNAISSIAVLKALEGGLQLAYGRCNNYISVIKSSDYGETWHEITTLGNCEYPFDFASKGNDTLYMGTIHFMGGGGVYGSYDGGQNWTIIGLDSHYVSSLGINSHGDLFAGTRGHQTYGNGGVFVQYAGETEWVQLIDNILVTSMVINSEDEIYIGCSANGYPGGVRRSTDNGQSWDTINSGLGYMGMENLILTPDNYLVTASEYSGSLYKSVEPTVDNIPEHPPLLYKVQPYPNPFHDHVIFELPVSFSGSGKILVYNSKGVLVKQSAIHACASLKYIAPLTCLPAGIYFYKLELDTGTTTGKIIKSK